MTGEQAQIQIMIDAYEQYVASGDRFAEPFWVAVAAGEAAGLRRDEAMILLAFNGITVGGKK